MKNWRPKDWKIQRTNPPHYEDKFEYMAGYEDGADAMLEALKRGGLYRKPWYDEALGVKHNERGWLVFIPDDEDKDEDMQG